MTTLRIFALGSWLLATVVQLSAASPLDGRWRLDPAHSSALDGWTAWDLVIATAENRISLQHDMTWRSTKVSATNVINTDAPSTVNNFFRVAQRHMAVYPEKDASAAVQASWLDEQRTLRTEAQVPIEISQGKTMLRITSEYRLLEGNQTLLLIELHQSRPRPLVYQFTKVGTEK